MTSPAYQLTKRVDLEYQEFLARSFGLKPFLSGISIATGLSPWQLRLPQMDFSPVAKFLSSVEEGIVNLITKNFVHFNLLFALSLSVHLYAFTLYAFSLKLSAFSFKLSAFSF